jgi:hypothetical protein
MVSDFHIFECFNLYLEIGAATSTALLTLYWPFTSENSDSAEFDSGCI